MPDKRPKRRDSRVHKVITTWNQQYDAYREASQIARAEHPEAWPPEASNWGGRHLRESLMPDRCWHIAEVILRLAHPNLEDDLLGQRLRFVGMSLADFSLEGYNNDKLPETATGHKP